MKNSKKLIALIVVALIVATLTTIAIRNEQPDTDMAASDMTSLQTARQAFWERDLERAEQQYRGLVESDGVSADTWGELGNVYYVQGKWQEAARAYTEAALKLIDNKQMGQAMHLHQLVLRMDGQQAMRIDEKLRAELTATVTQ